MPVHKQYHNPINDCRTSQTKYHKLKQSIEAKLEALLKEYTSQFTQDESSIGTTPLTEMMIDTDTPQPVLQKPTNW